jgi:hypothetical protein
MHIVAMMVRTCATSRATTARKDAHASSGRSGPARGTTEPPSTSAAAWLSASARAFCSCLSASPVTPSSPHTKRISVTAPTPPAAEGERCTSTTRQNSSPMVASESAMGLSGARVHWMPRSAHIRGRSMLSEDDREAVPREKAKRACCTSLFDKNERACMRLSRSLELRVCFEERKKSRSSIGLRSSLGQD